MEKFKLKKVKITKNETIIILSLLLLIACLYLLYPVNTFDNETSYLSDSKVGDISDFSFEGKLVSETIFDDKYAYVTYQNGNVKKSYYLDLLNNEVTDYLGFIKDEYENDFKNKVHELLLRKFPTSIVTVLESKAKAAYIFTDEYLMINYDVKNILETTREFNLKVYYVEIDKYLEFATKKAVDVTYDDGFNYDENKVSISFTFDDGPNGKKTKQLIDALEDYKMSATFFMVASKLEGDQDTVKKVSDSHSEIGYHSLEHKYFTSQTTKEIQSDFKKANTSLKAITGKYFHLTRPPYGDYNKNVLNAIDNAFIRWDLDTNDWRYKDVEYIQNYVLDNFKDGSIILFHDSYNTSVEAAISLMETLYLMDVQVVSVSELAKLKDIKLEDHNVYYSFTK